MIQIKVEKYKIFEISNDWLEKFKEMNTIARLALNVFHLDRLIIQILILSLEG